jgi:hypothetical protein
MYIDNTQDSFLLGIILRHKTIRIGQSVDKLRKLNQFVRHAITLHNRFVFSVLFDISKYVEKPQSDKCELSNVKFTNQPITMLNTNVFDNDNIDNVVQR